MNEDIITAVNSLPKGKGLIIYCPGVKVPCGVDGFVATDLDTDDLKQLATDYAALQAKVAEYEAMQDAAVDVVNEYEQKSCDCDEHLLLAVGTLKLRLQEEPKP